MKTLLDKPKALGYNKPMKITRQRFIDWGRQGGKSKSKRKTDASKKNGEKGGRPKKETL